MFDYQNTLFDLVEADNNIKSIGTNEIRITLNKDDIDNIYNGMEESIDNVESINSIKFSNSEREDISRKALDLIDFSLKSLSSHKVPYLTDLKEFYIDKFKVENDDIVFIRGIYKGNRVSKDDIDNYFKEKVLLESAKVASMYCALGRIQLRRGGFYDR